MKLLSRLLLPSLLLAFISGCTVAPYQPAQPPVESRSDQAGSAPEPPAEAEPTEPTESAVATPLPDSGPMPQPAPSPAPQPQPQQNQAVVALLSDAEQSRAAGDYRSAQGSLQRAQRIAPRDPEVYYSLAQTHMQLEDYDLAEQVALKGVSVAQGNRVQLKRLWSLVAKIRLRAGDPSGSREADNKAAAY